MDSDKIAVKRYRFFFIYTIDLGYFLNSNEDIRRLQDLRARDVLYEKLRAIFGNTHARAFVFKDPNLETERIKARLRAALAKGGKNIWSDLFFKRQVPILFRTEQNMMLSPSNQTGIGRHISDGDISQIKDTGITFDRCEFRIFREGTLSFVYEFSQKNPASRQSIDELITILSKLESDTFKGYLYNIREILQEWQSPSHKFQELNLTLRPLDDETNTVIKTSSVKHSCVFLEEVVNIETGEAISAENLQNRYFLLGILNKANWYNKYGDKYIDDVFGKNVGYRKDEIYLTDKDSTLVLLSDYWDPDKSLQYYVYDLVLAIQIQLAKLAFLDFFLRHIQTDPYSKKALINPSSKEAIKLVLGARNIITILQEATDIDSLIVHGFTRRFIKQLVKERNVLGYLELIERRVANISSAIELKSSIDIGKLGIRWGIVAVFVAIFSSNVLMEWISSILKLLIDIIMH